ncbi:7737_t:CDS:2, partial [Funneliformis mosseae]
MYEDMNTLYLGAMTQYMPIEILGKVASEKISDIQSIVLDAEISYTLEVDLEAQCTCTISLQIICYSLSSSSDIYEVQDEGDLFLMKDKTKGDPIGESVCLKPKMYSVLPAGYDPKTSDDPDSEDSKKKHSIQKAKGIKKCVVKRELLHDKFLECLRNKKLTWHDMYGLRSYDHQIYLKR